MTSSHSIVEVYERFKELADIADRPSTDKGEIQIAAASLLQIACTDIRGAAKIAERWGERFVFGNRNIIQTWNATSDADPTPEQVAAETQSRRIGLVASAGVFLGCNSQSAIATSEERAVILRDTVVRISRLGGNGRDVVASTIMPVLTQLAEQVSLGELDRKAYDLAVVAATASGIVPPGALDGVRRALHGRIGGGSILRRLTDLL
jgi:hypothetical protein